MAEYIEKQVAIKELCETYEHEYLTASGAFDEYATRIVPNVLRNLPPADVRPVVRGQWKFATNPMLHDGPGPSCWCSECKKPPIDKKNVWYHLDGTFAREGEGFVLSDFCPNCGADMRGGDAE